MRCISTKWKIVIASVCLGSAAMLAGCQPQLADEKQPDSATENSTGEPADVDIKTPGLNIEIDKGGDSAKVDIDVPEDKQSDAVDVDVNSPE